MYADEAIVCRSGQHQEKLSKFSKKCDFFIDEIREGINLNTDRPANHYKAERENLFTLDLKICRLRVSKKT